MEEQFQLFAPLANYYGILFLSKSDGLWYLNLENWNGINTIQVSHKFAEAFIKEFGDDQSSLQLLPRG